jgi:hypothetical protein
MSEQLTAEVVTESDETTAPAAPEAPETPTEGTTETQIEDKPTDPGPVPAEVAPLPEVEATVGHDLVSGKYLVSIVTRHPDPTVISVNGRGVWEGVG